MLPKHHLSPLKRVFVLFSIVALTVGSMGSALAPLISPVLGQDAQNTDIFTGQFIPAYLGAAYDPSEAYKQMAGLPVYVYSYDTADKIVNNYVYRTQIRADGSFQAAGLANASHYGVCVPINDDGFVVNNGVSASSISAFRPPISGAGGDNLEAVFAFNEGLYPRTPTNPHDQLGKDTELSNVNAHITNTTPPPADKQGCRTFFTSNRTVDIANHTNIFPLVPTSVLSVMIHDDYSKSQDLYNTNTPYEIYAQRISIDSVNQAICDTANDNSCKQALDVSPNVTNYIANGPIIRGRSIQIMNSDGQPAGTTIFQAFAPTGVYAITFWRPDARDAKTTITYLTYNGSQPLNTKYNGIAFENVINPYPQPTNSLANKVVISQTPDGTPKTTDWDQWKLATRDYTATGGFVWRPLPGNLNIWGMTTASSHGTTVPVGGGTASVGNSWFGFIDPMTRKCAKTSGGDVMQTGTISYWGIYLFSTSCNQDSDRLPTTTTEITVGGYTTTINGQNVSYAGIDNQSVTAGGNEGPANYTLPLQSIPDNGAQMNLYVHGQALAPTSFDLMVDGRLLRNVAISEPGGRLVIPGVYFDNTSPKQYEVIARNAGPALPFGRGRSDLSFVIDGASLKNPTLALNNLGRVDLDSRASAAGQFLASLSLSNLMQSLHIKPVLAFGSQPDQLKRDDMRLWLDMASLRSINDSGFFNSGNYNLTQVEAVLPSQVTPNNSSDYVIFNRWGNDNDHKNDDGLILASNTDQSTGPASATPSDGDNPRIVGVRLKEKLGTAVTLDQAFAAYQGYNQGSESQTMPLTVRLTFKKTNVAQPAAPDQTQQDQSASGQNAVQYYPDQLTAEWPITLQKTPGGKDGDYQVIYDPISLSVTPPGCTWGGVFDVAGKVKGIGCEIANGIIHFMGWGVGKIIDNITTIDPLQYSVTRASWNIMRNFVNGMTVLLLVIAGIAIMLRYEPKTFSLQQVLTKLIMTIVLVNFSILIIQFAIDFANVFSTGGYYFLTNVLNDPGKGTTGAGSASAAAGLAALMVYVFSMVMMLNGYAVLAILLGIIAIFIAMLYVFAKAFYYWIVRQVILIICIIAAPIALSARLLPGTQSYYNKWKTLITKTLINQVLFAFVLALGMAMLKYSITGDTNFVSALASLGIAVGLFWYSTKFPSQAVAVLDANLTQGLAGNVVKKLAAGTKKMRGEMSREARMKRKAENEGEDKARRDFDLRQLGVAGRATRFLRQTTPLLGKSPSELDEIREKAEQTGARTGIRAFTTEGQDPVAVLRRALKQDVKNAPGHERWSQADIDAEVDRMMAQDLTPIGSMFGRAPKFVDPATALRYRNVVEELNGLPEIRQQNRAEEVVGKQIDTITSSMRGSISDEMSTGATDLFGKLNNTPSTHDTIAQDPNSEINVSQADILDYADKNKTDKLYPVYQRLAAIAPRNIEDVRQARAFLKTAANDPEIRRVFTRFGWTQENFTRQQHRDVLWTIIARDISTRSSVLRAFANKVNSGNF